MDNTFKNGKHIWIDSAHQNMYVVFRKEFDLQTKIISAKFNIFAEGRYQAYINGHYLGFGPARYEPQYKEYDSYEIDDELLKIGRNCISVVVHYVGKDTFQYIKDKPAFIGEFLIADENEDVQSFYTDNTWEALECKQWKPSVKMNIQLDYAENFDARVERDNWQKAVEVENDSVYHLRSIPLLKEYDKVTPTVIDRGFIKETPIIYYITAGDYFDLNGIAEVEFSAYIYSPVTQEVEIGVDKGEHNIFYLNGKKLDDFKISNTAVEKRCTIICLNEGENLFEGKLSCNDNWQAAISFPLSSKVNMTSDNIVLNAENTAFTVAWEEIETIEGQLEFPMCLDKIQYVVFDFGVEVFGRVQLKIDAPEGTIIDLAYSENLMNGRVNPIKSSTWYADRYTAKEGMQSWKTFDVRGFRYLQLAVRKPSNNRNVIIHDVSTVITTYPVEYRGEFSCSDELLTKIWSVGRYTLHMCMEDAYIDCPWRERGQWWGDARVEFLVNLATFGDYKLMRRGLCQIGRGQREDGLVPGVYPNTFYGVITDFSLIWVSSIWDYYWYSGDRTILIELLPQMKNVLNYFIERCYDGLTIADPEKWTFIDWADIERNGKSTVINAFFYKSLMDAAQILSILGDEQGKNRYLEIAKTVKTSINKFLWNGKCYSDSIIDGKQSPKCSIHTNALLISYDIADKSRVDGMVFKIKTELEDVLKDGIKHVASGYFMHYIFEALAKAEEYEFSLRYIRQWWGWYIDNGHGTFQHYHHTNSSLCHAWSCSPVLFLSQNILGVKFPNPADSRKIRMEPQFSQLNWASGKYPHPNGGTIDITWQKDDMIYLNVDLPEECDLELILPEGYQLLNGKTNKYENVKSVEIILSIEQ